MEQNKDANYLPIVIFLGVSIGLVAMTVLLPGGYDSFNYYLRPWRPETTIPGVTQLFLEPLILLPPFPSPLRWTALVVVTILAAYWATATLGTRWWITLLSFPFLWMVWHGQIEVFPLVGIALGWLVIHRGWHPVWFGVAVLFLLVKVQVGYGIVLLYGWWLYRRAGLMPLAWASASAGGILLVSLLAYPGWIPFWLESLEDLSPTTRFFNSSVFFPLSLVAWGFALWPADVGHLARVRLFAAATLLGSPYFAIYHCTTLMTTLNNRWMLAVSWLAAIPVIAFPQARFDWSQRFGWLIPTVVIVVEMWRIYQKRENAKPSQENYVMVEK
jgi:hypothetical protein